MFLFSTSRALPTLFPPADNSTHSPDTRQPTAPDLRTSHSRMDLSHGETLKLYSPGEAQIIRPGSRGPFCSSEASHQHKKKRQGQRIPTPPQDSGGMLGPIFPDRKWPKVLVATPSQPSYLSSPPQCIPSLPVLTQQRGHKPECEDLQGHVWELQDLTDCTVQLMGTDRGQVLHGQGHYCVISQVHQYISCWNTGRAGSAEAHHQNRQHSPPPFVPYHNPSYRHILSRPH